MNYYNLEVYKSIIHDKKGILKDYIFVSEKDIFQNSETISVYYIYRNEQMLIIIDKLDFKTYYKTYIRNQILDQIGI